MPSTIAAVTTGVGGVVTTADASGNLNLLAGTTTVVALTTAGAAVTGTLSNTTGANFATSSGNVGIGTASPNVKFEVAGPDTAAGAGLRLSRAADTTNFWDIFRDGTTGILNFKQYGAAASAMVLNTSNNVGIGTSSPVAKLQIETSIDRQAIRMRDTDATAGKYWNFGPDGSNSIVLENNAGAGVYIADGGTAWAGLSDERLKTNIQALGATNGLAAINKLDTVTFNWKDARLTGTNMGLIALNVRDVFPSLVSISSTRTIHLDDGTEQAITDPLGVDYTGLVVPLIKAIQELKAIIDTQATRIAALEAKP